MRKSKGPCVGCPNSGASARNVGFTKSLVSMSKFDGTISSNKSTGMDANAGVSESSTGLLKVEKGKGETKGSKKKNKSKKKVGFMGGKKRSCPIPRSTFTTFMDEGVMHFRSGRYRKALFCFDRALELRATDRPALIWRSQCHLKLGNAVLALKDAQNSFKGDTQEEHKHIMGIYFYAEALFSLGQFERALIAYQQGYRRRRDMEGFRIGIQKSQDAIRRAIDDRQATQIEDLDEIYTKILAIQNPQIEKAGHCCVRVSSRDRVIQDPFEGEVPSKARQRWVDREILGQLKQDKDYLKKFLRRPDVQSDQAGSEALRFSATEALNYLSIREDFWRQQNPMYARKVGLNFNNKMVAQYEEQENARREACLRIKMDAAEGAVSKNLTLIHHALEIGRAKDCQLECERTLRQMKEMSLRLLPRKPEFMCEVLHYKGRSLMQLKNYDQAITTFQAELEIAAANELSDQRGRATDFLAKSFVLKKSYGEAAETWEGRVPQTKVPLERTYLYHEIGRCYLDMSKPDIAKFYANQCLEEAQKIKDNIWAMNAQMLLGQIEIKNMQLENAQSHFEAAEALAVKCGNKANTSMLREAQQCLKVWIEKREQQQENVVDPEDAHHTNSDDSLDNNESEGPKSGEE